MKTLLHRESSNLHSSKYDPDKKQLYVTFKDKGAAGKTCRYYDVDPATHAGLENAESAGKYFINAIRNNHKGEPID